MRAVQIQKFGDPSEVRISDVPTPVPHAAEVLVKVEATGVNPSDLVNIRGGFHHTTLPRIIGRDFAGTIVEGPEELKGRHVWGAGGDIGLTRDGAHAEYIAIPRSAVSIRPSTISAIEAATVGVPFVTAWCALVDRARLQSGDYVVVSGAAGAVGSAAVQIAAWRGAGVIALVKDESERANVDVSKTLAIAQSDKNDLEAIVKDVTGGKGAAVAFNTVGASIFEPLYKSLALFGRQVFISRVGGADVKLDIFDFYRRDLELIGVDTAKVDANASARILDQLRLGFEMRKIAPIKVNRTYPLDGATEAYVSIAKGAPGKVVLIP